MFRHIFQSAAILAVLTHSAYSATPTWKFGIMGDTHDAPPRQEENAGVAIGYVKLVNKEFIKHQVDFVVQCGDLADAERGQNPKGFEIRFDAADELRKAGIPFYALRGNHDISPMRQKQMLEFFIPGVKGTERPKGFVLKGLDYGFRHKNTSLYFLDIDNSLNPSKLVEWSKWIASYRKNSNRPPHCIVFTHRNLHVPLSFRENLFSKSSNSAIDEQNEFYKNLCDSGVDFFVSAHLHIHLRGFVKSPDKKYGLNNLVCAPCGDKVFPINLPLPKEDRENIVNSEALCVGYYIVTVSDDVLKIDFYAIPSNGKQPAPVNAEFKIRDSWTINLPAPARKDEMLVN